MQSPTTTLASRSTQGSRSQPGPSTIKTVVTSPPWARDEPPSPEETPANRAISYFDPSAGGTTTNRPSFGTTDRVPSGSRWWAFAAPRGAERPSRMLSDSDEDLSRMKEKKRFGIPTRSRSWMVPPSVASRRDKDRTRMKGTVGTIDEDGAPFIQSSERVPPLARTRTSPWNMQIPIPERDPFTAQHSQTPGWDTPWTPRMRVGFDEDGLHNGNIPNGRGSSKEDLDPWKKRKKKLRTCILTNPYVPLLFRFINIIFTAAALAIAIRIGIHERRNGVKGAIGSSPSLVIIFAPLTLVHVIIAIYIEYFGRPLGLWRTSSKLLSTLVEVLFICAWSAALSLCFDNFFTSLLPCAAYPHESWYTNIPRPASPLPSSIDKARSVICNDQLALIILVFVGLLMYCANLVISLFRIVEKVKYQIPEGQARHRH